MMIEMLTRMGYETSSCGDGDEAISHIYENPQKYDLIVSDYTMPRLTGFEMAGLLSEEFAYLPIILISGDAGNSLKQAALKCPNIKAVMRKPVNSRDLRKTIKDVLSETKETAAA